MGVCEREASWPEKMEGGWQAIGTHTLTRNDPPVLSAPHRCHCFPRPSEESHCSLPEGKEEGKRLVNNHTFQGIKCNQQAERNSTRISITAYTVPPNL